MPEHRLYVTTRTLWPYSKSPVLVALIRFHLGDQQKNSVQRSDKRTAPETRKATPNEVASFIFGGTCYEMLSNVTPDYTTSDTSTQHYFFNKEQTLK